MFAGVGIAKVSGSYTYSAMIIKLLILAICVFVCVALDDDYIDESKDFPMQVQQQPFNFDNLQRLRAKFHQDAHYRNNNGNGNGNGSSNKGNLRNSYRSGDKDQDKNSLEKTQNNENLPKFNEMEFYDELEASLPYGIQNVRRALPTRATRSQMHLHKPKTTFQSLCPSRRTIIPLETVSYEYRPDHYEEVTCFHSYAPSRDYMSETNKVCSEAGFTCIQLNRTVYLTRRAKGTDCWESETRIVPSGCECMWPKHTFGDIITYH